MRREAAAAREASTAELSLMRRQLASAQTAAADAEAAHAEAEKVRTICSDLLCRVPVECQLSDVLLTCCPWHFTCISIINKCAFRRMFPQSDISARVVPENKYLMMRSQPHRGSCDVQKLTAAAKEVDEQQSQIFRLEVRLAEANKKLEHTADLEKELLHYRYCNIHVCSETCPNHSVN